jgi:hypothetical protein
VAGLDPKTVMLGVGGLLVIFFLYRVLKGAAARTVAIPVAIAAGLGLTGVGFHPGLGVVAALVCYWVVSYLVELSIRLATAAVVVSAIGLAVYAFMHGGVPL